MKPLASPFTLALLLMPWLLGPAPAGQGPGVVLRPCCDAAAAPGRRGSSQEHWKVKTEPESPWSLAYVPIRSCHRVLKDKHGEFSPPALRADFPVSFWCNWTIWAGSRRHILIYIQGFLAQEACSKNQDKIVFEGVSSLVEGSVVYACWKKQMHVFATFAGAVHVVLLKRHLPNQREAGFKGKYYIFQEQQGESSSKDATSGTSASKLPEKGAAFQSGCVESLRGALGSTTALSSELVQGRGVPLGTRAVGSPTELIPCARTQALETTAPCGLRAELLGAQEAQGMGITPTAAQDMWGQNPSVSPGSVRSALLETPLLGALQGAEAFWQPADVRLESSQPVLQPSLRPEGLGHLQLSIQPTGTQGGLACSEPLSPGPGHSQSSLGHLSLPKPELGTTGLQHTKLRDVFPLGSFRGAARRRTVLHPTAAGLAVPALAMGLEQPLTPVPVLGTGAIPVLLSSSTAPVPAGFASLGLIPGAPLPPQVGSVSMVASVPAALDQDPVRHRDMSPASPGGQEMLSPSPPCHPSELGTDRSSRCLGMDKLVLGQADGTTATVGLVARIPSPGPALRLAQPQGHTSSGSGVTAAPLPDPREQHQGPVQLQDSAASDKPAAASSFRGFQMQGTTETVPGGAGQRMSASFSSAPALPDLPAALWGETLPGDQKPREPSGVPRSSQMPEGQQGKHAELGPPWVTEYFPIKSCHLLLGEGSGTFHLPVQADIRPNIWCNWTIQAGPQRHVVIYIQGFQGSDGCGSNQDRIIFQGLSSSVETQVVFACHSRGTLIFAARATQVQVLFLSGRASRSHEYRHFKGQYYVFREPESVGSSSDATAAPLEASTKESWRPVVTKGSLSMLTAPPGPPAAGRTQPDTVSPGEVAQHPPDLVEDGQSGADLSERGQDETRLERNPEARGSKGRETEDGKLVEPAPAGQDSGSQTEPPALEGDTEAGAALLTTVPCHPAASPCSEVPSSSAGVPGTPGVAAAAHHTQTPELAEPPLNTSTEPPPHPSPDVVSLGGSNEDLFDLLSSLENDTGLQSQHHPGDVLFEVTAEIKPKDWIPHGGSELRKGLLESLKNHIQKNLKLPANRVSEIKLKGVKRRSDASLVLTLWLHLEPEDRNVSLLLRSQLQRLLGASGEQLRLLSLLVEDVNECQAGLSLCGEEAECLNGEGTYLCRCKKDYEDLSPTKSGTLCIRTPRAGISTFLRHADMLAGAALVAGLVMLVAFCALCVTALWGQTPRRTEGPAVQPDVQPAVQPAMELHNLGECLHLNPLQLKLRARTPEWLWSVRAPPGQAGPGFPESPLP